MAEKSPLIGMPVATRVFVARHLHYPDAASPRDQAQLAEIERTLRAVRDAGLAIVEGEDGR